MKQRQKQKLRQLEQALAEALVPSIPADPIQFCTEILGFQPTEYQKDLISKFQKSQFTAARWCRQSGKTQTVSALLLHYALTNPNTCIGIVGPSWRQTKYVIRRINTLLKKLPKGLYEKPQQTAVRLKNGSIIEAYPNNPETIRGPTLHVVYADEFNFIPNDKEVYDAILFTLTATNGKFICTSTPWHTDSIFWRIWHETAYSDYAKSHVTYQQATEPNGPLKQEILQKIRRQLENDQWRWQREMQAEWAEDQNTWLTQTLIVSCIDPNLEYIGLNKQAQGEFYTGLDLGKHQNPSVLTVIAKTQENTQTTLKLVHIHRFPLKTPYATVIGYTKTLCEKWQTIQKILVDMTGVGEYIVEDMKNTPINAQIQGIKFTQETKEQLANNLKQLMTEKQLKIPYDPELIAELNTEHYQLTKDGRIRLTHPEGTKDDRFWSLALAAYAAKTQQPPPNLWIVPK